MYIQKVKGSTFCIDTGMTYVPFYKINDQEIIMLDSGWAQEEKEGIEALLEENNLKVVGIICSHAHVDHIGNINHLKEKYNCIIAMSAYEALVCSSNVNLKAYCSSSQTLSDVTDYFGHMVCETDIKISDNQESVYVSGIKFKIFHTPGHSPAHICIVTPDDVGYVADALISYEVMENAKIPYSFILKKDLESKKKLYDFKCSRYIVAHKAIYDDITKLITDNIDFYKDRALQICNFINSPMTMEDIIKNVIEKFNIRIGSAHKYALIETIVRFYVEYLKEIGMIDSIIEERMLKYVKMEAY
ncbi:MBL fold metallo-hydrolase [Clostridium sp. ZS2-4]|uniref:MBL fold metallo-hydrolase n=1 Tax=Clostridium sp. ZS2-4 TaxID=2987703 RepID=UPI00227D14F9|nr:MBL fold metallo-hydrolase [Clostridium sp. ZS2-4]MCY6354235.1 MBL fold metallo-hydrolase [Clostridium sp. ZS2-4]